MNMKNDVKIELIKYWVYNILKSPAMTGQLQHFNVSIPDELMPRSIVVSKIASTIAKQFLTTSCQGSHKRRRNSIKNGTVLSSAVNCCGKFASKVLKEIAKNSEENMLKLNKECFDSIHVTE